MFTMKGQVGASSHMSARLVIAVLLCFSIVSQQVEARSAQDEYVELVAPTTTTADSSSGAMDDPSNSATTSDGADTSEDICSRCYEGQAAAENLIAIHANLVAKQKEIIRRKNKAASVATNSKPVINPSLRSTPPPASSSNDSMDSESPQEAISTTNRTSTRKSSSSLINRTIQYPEPIIISRLRVARSPLQGEQTPSVISDTAALSHSNKKIGRNKKDPLLKRLKQELEQQLNATCSLILNVQDCLHELSRTCIGDLRFHMLEVWASQWHGKLSCHYRSNPNLKVFPGLTQRIIIYDPPTPIARPITTEEEVRIRLHKRFPNGAIRPPGVMLKPMSSNSGPAAQPKSMSFLNQQQSGQQLQPIGKIYHSGQLLPIQSSGNYLNRLQYSTPDDSFNLVNVGKVILLPSCFVVMVAFVVVTSLYLRRDKEEITDKF